MESGDRWAEVRDVVDDCVHCGFCLDTCPTYALWAQEADSPRGRVLLAGELAAGAEVTPELAQHFDTCLGCLACVTSCPSGVRYDRLIELVRPEIERRHERSTAERALRLLLFETLPYPKRLRALAPVLGATRRLAAERLPERIAVLAKVAPRPPSRAELRRPIPARTPAAADIAPRGRVALLLGCVQRVFFADVHRATIGVLAADGWEVLAPELPDCCGALELHAGEEESALARARATIAAFDALGPLNHVAVNSAGCGSAMKQYGELLGTPVAHAFAARVRDVSELIAGDGAEHAPRGPLPLRVVYHDACHLRHGQQIRDQPRAMLRAIPELELLEAPAEHDVCCGSAGVYNLLQPRAAAELGARKARLLLETGAEAIATANPGCAAQLDRHLRELAGGRDPIPIHHPIELVWRSIQAAG